ncbi:hypothetical protein ACJ41O_013854 [Fusarium nematophilum]
MESNFFQTPAGKPVRRTKHLNGSRTRPFEVNYTSDMPIINSIHHQSDGEKQLAALNLPNASDEHLSTVVARDTLSRVSSIKHVGRHLEQLALFALPTIEDEWLEDDVDSDGQNDAASELDAESIDNGSMASSQALASLETGETGGRPVVQGMEEKHLKTAREGIKVLQDGILKRQVAATKCNDLSSRSHTVFTITAYVRKKGEEEYISAGKLNLVDLAGSENIQRSGAENKRAAEAGLINKSLLTLGRVINALVDRSPHIPYRESKLTRLLQDSLGGQTKTCIIATVSPGRNNLEETISTLDYAFRAKDIRNKPQFNALLNKKMLLQDFKPNIISASPSKYNTY